MKSINRSSIAIFLFWSVSILHVISILLKNESLFLASKPLLLIFLCSYFISESYPYRDQKKINYVFVALLFSWFGDILLMFTSSGEIYFITGLASFLVAQIFYIITYSKFRASNSHKKGKAFKATMTLLFVIFMLILWLQLYPGLGQLLVPVSVYAITILLMAIFALFRLGVTSNLSYKLVLLGAIVFLISDSMIAINKFIMPFEYEGLLVIVTYIIAQYLIVRGLIEHLKSEKS